MKAEKLKPGKRKSKLTGRLILVTAGPTIEKIDPVRFISNLSSGKMGYAIAETLVRKNAIVKLVSGPVSIHLSHPCLEIIQVTSAAEMLDQCNRIFPVCDAAILSAAVSDYTPVKQFAEKIKRKKETLILELKPTEDIAATLGSMKRKDQVLSGFALESENEVRNARVKLRKKNFDFIVMNSLRDEDACFGTETNRITIIDRNNKVQKFELKKKNEVAEDIIGKLEEYF